LGCRYCLSKKWAWLWGISSLILAVIAYKLYVQI
jgi:hypothetical protein